MLRRQHWTGEPAATSSAWGLLSAALSPSSRAVSVNDVLVFCLAWPIMRPGAVSGATRALRLSLIHI
eukprot:3153326-Prymnesium_polylepis.3